MVPPLNADLDELVKSVLASQRYKDIDPSFVRDIAQQELGKRRSLKEAVKATKNKLHQVVGVYLDERPNYPAWLTSLENGYAQGPHEFRLACRQVMAHHASTRERLPILDRFFSETLAGVPSPQRVIDVACGLNPLAIPWMPFPEGAEYLAVDVAGSLIDFLNQFFPLVPVHGQAMTANVIPTINSQPDGDVKSMIKFPRFGRFDLALILKTIPCLEQVDKMAGRQLLETIQAEYLLVSFPSRSLGGRAKGMPENYEAHFYELIQGKGWQSWRYEFPDELAFLIRKDLRTGSTG